MDDDAFEKKYNTMEVDFIRSQQLFCRDVLKLGPGQRAVISNGRVSAPLHSSAKAPFTGCKSSGKKKRKEESHSVQCINESLIDLYLNIDQLMNH